MTTRPRRDYDPTNCFYCGRVVELGEVICWYAGRFSCRKCASDKQAAKAAKEGKDATVEATQKIGRARNGKVNRSGKPDS